jgi:hypothetical protein
LKIETLKKLLEKRGVLQKLSPLTSQQIEEIRNDFPDIPEDYLAFLAECGSGDMGVYLYSGPVKANEIFDYEELKEEDPIKYEKLEQTWLIGDYGMGDTFGYWIQNGKYHLVDVDHACLEIQERSKDFCTFLASLVTSDNVGTK